MSYVLIVDGAVATYPYSFAQLRRDNPDVSYPADPSDAKMAEFGAPKVVLVTQPVVPIDKNVVEGTPVLIDGNWTQVWIVVDASAQEIADRQKAAADAQARFDVAADAFVQSFIGMTKAGVETYTTNNTANLAAVRSLMIKQNIMLWVLARREFGQ